MNRFINLFRFSLIGLIAAAFEFAPTAHAQQPTGVYTNGIFQEYDSNGNLVPVNVVINANQLGQELVVGANNAVVVNPVTKGNLSSSVIASGSAVTLSTATPKTVTSVSLGIGTWRVYGYVDYVLASATSTLFQQGFATTTNSFTNSLQSQDTSTNQVSPVTTSSPTFTFATPVQQITVTSGTQTVYLVAEGTFSAGAETAYGTLFYQQVK